MHVYTWVSTFHSHILLLTIWPLEGGEREEHEGKEYLLMFLLGLYHRAMYSLGLRCPHCGLVQNKVCTLPSSYSNNHLKCLSRGWFTENSWCWHIYLYRPHLPQWWWECGMNYQMIRTYSLDLVPQNSVSSLYGMLWALNLPYKEWPLSSNIHVQCCNGSANYVFTE